MLNLGLPEDENADDVTVTVHVPFSEKELGKLRALSPGVPARMILRELAIEQLAEIEAANQEGELNE